MGGSSYSSDAYKTISSSNKSKPSGAVFTSRGLHKDMNPKGVAFREARDSDAHPESLAIIVALDETGSMGDIPKLLCTGKMGTLIETMLAHKIEHPAVMFMGIGDHYSDNSPLQVGQFESGATELNKWLTSVYLEGNGGGQCMESYSLAWLFAARHTSIDCFEKRGEKGFLFTVGDEKVHAQLEGSFLKDLMGYESCENITSAQLLSEVQRTYEVFHIHVNSTGYRNDSRIINDWKQLLGERLLILEDHEAVAELIASTVGVMHGISLDVITKNFDSKTAGMVSTSLAHLHNNVGLASKSTGGALKL